MKVFSVVGITQSGKTTVIEKVLEGLRKRRYSAGSVKEIHFEDFAIDETGTNTYRHYQAGAQLVTARGYQETDILFKERLEIKEILRFYDHDYVALEGVEDYIVPKIITAHSTEEIDAKLDETVFLISGQIASQLEEYQGIPVLNALEESEEIVDLIENKVFQLLPNLAEECCGECGYNCRELTGKILRGELKRSACPIGQQNAVQLTINGQQIEMVPFVQDILKNSVQAVVQELDGFQENARIEVIIRDND